MRFTSFSLRAVALLVLAAGTFAMADSIDGTVTNKTNGKPSVGDKVTLLSLSAGLDEVGTAKTDARGHFTLNRPTAAPYLIKVEHQKGAYFKNVPPNVTSVEITVYDVATKVEGVSTEADVLRVEADSGQLKVTENYFVKNVSSPPRTESSEHTYEVVMPADAVLDGAATVGPSGMPLAATPDPVTPKGHYAFSFPIRPNEGDQGTRFQLSYHVPYSGSYKFTPKVMQDTDNLAVMVPKGMKFEPGAGTSYQTVPPDGTDGQTFLVRGVKPGEPLEFAISGTGTWPREAQGGGAGMAGGPQGPQVGGDAAPQGGPNGAPGGGLGNPIDTPDPLSKYKYWILGALALVLAAAAAFLLKKPAGEVAVAPPAAPEPQIAAFAVPVESKRQLLLEALKEELFAIESEKIAGKLSPEEYVDLKAALETVLRRALGRS
ncbi:carboxypeptidase-like regulatory domain-containing protein [Acidicapsa ligni]|uniref:carboxypeptidase-like regulatory domain-containing protein n=1 Tax=Acidicapsa ligni TaxID=542300 RepID=UPI0021E0248A|nr:carboxypeptidase-like regulatory domain-containing protein [Acidicapsa ligni]